MIAKEDDIVLYKKASFVCTYRMNMNFNVFFLNLAIGLAVSQDPCNTKNVLTDPKRSTAYATGKDEHSQCDHDLIPGWYKIKDNGNIAQSCPEFQRCGTLTGVWIKGPLPSKKGDTGKVTTCQRGFIGCCETQETIDVKNCGTFNVFNLPALQSCPGRYCIDGNKTRTPCPPGFSSNDGFEPCKRIDITFTSKPTIIPYIPSYERLSENRSLTFECQIPLNGQNGKYLYDIRWFVNNNVVAEKKLIQFENLKTIGSLYTRDWNPTLSLGFKVQCEIRARGNISSVPTAYVTSSVFFAGVKIQQNKNDVKAGDTVTIKVKSTVPLACIKSPVQYCYVRLELYSFKDQVGDSLATCSQALTTQKINASKCGINFYGSNWNQWHYLTVTSKTDPTTRGFYTASVKLRAISTFDIFWKNFHLPEVKIRIHSKQVSTGTCLSYHDPHIKTFDVGYNTATHLSGEFLLFNHTKKPLEIHTIQRWRSDLQFEANCAIAIRAASDIFIIYGCQDPLRWITRRLNCDNKRQVLEVYSRNSGQEYEILLPTGTQVKVIIQRKWLDIHVYASSADFGFTEGLCGTYNNNDKDDWKMRGGGTASSFDQFVKSWSIPQAESLFIKKVRTEVLKTAVLYCSCVQDVFSKNILTEKAECSWRENLPLCKGLNWKQDLCQIGLRNRRDATDDESDIDASPDVVSLTQSALKIFEWRNGWSEQKARRKCEEVLKTSAMYSVCSSLESVKIGPVVESCIDDIKTTGTDRFLKSSVDTVMSQCTFEVQTNISLWSNSSSGSHGKSIKDIIMEQDCPKNCSGIGRCINGVCQCPSGYTSDDCSVNIDSIPEVVNASDSSLCDLKTRSCTVMSIFGNGFYDSRTIRCSITSAEFNDTELLPGTSSKSVTGDLISFAEVSCPVVSLRGRQKRSVLAPGSTSSYLISITMNGKNYSHPVPMIIYDSSCTKCLLVNRAFICSGRKDICVKKGACYDITDHECDGLRGQIDDERAHMKNYLWIIGAVLGGLAICGIGFIVVIQVFAKKRQTFPSNPDLKKYAQ